MQYLRDDYKASVVYEIAFMCHKDWCEILCKRKCM